VLRPPKPFFERVKLPLILIAYVLASEWASPFPFRVSFPARLAFVALFLLVLREFHHARLEVDEGWAGKNASAGKKFRSHFDGVSQQTWLKVQRVVSWALCLYVFGMMLNTLTTRCSSPIQCTVLAPRMAVENLPTFLNLAFGIAFGMFQLAFMFYAMVKVGSYKIVMPGTVKVSFDDVWGQDAAKRKVMEQVKLLDDSEHIEKAGGYMPKGLLLYGPPGTGKTYLAKAAANYSSKPLILVPPGAFQATFVGINLLKVWTLFRTVRKLARRYGGVIVFIDEIDSLGSRGGEVEGQHAKANPTFDMGGPKLSPGCVQQSCEAAPQKIVGVGMNQMGTLEAFLSAMDGMEEPRGMLNRILVFLGFKPLKPYDYKYLMMGATNMLSALDPALLRAGRFGRKIHVDYPKVDGRLKTYEGYATKVSNDLTSANLTWAARNHEHGTGAEIKDIVNEALLVTFRDDRDDPGVIHFDDLMHAMIWVKLGESEGPFKREAARWQVSVHEAGHAVAFHLLNRERQSIWFASIDQRSGFGGMVYPTNLHEDWMKTREEMMNDLKIGLASRVAETLLLGTTTNGHGGDGQQVTEGAIKMVKVGLGTDVGAWKTDTKDMHRQAEEILEEALAATQELLSQHKGDVEAIAKLLFEKGTITGDEIVEVLG
jgi:cell division protease FtsH